MSSGRQYFSDHSRGTGWGHSSYWIQLGWAGEVNTLLARLRLVSPSTGPAWASHGSLVSGETYKSPGFEDGGFQLTKKLQVSEGPVPEPT